MLAIFLYSANALLPIALLTALGYFLKRKKVISIDFLKNGNKLLFNVFIPVLIFYSIYCTEDLSGINWPLILFILLAVLLLFFLGLLIIKLFVKDPKCKGVVLQSVFRSNYSIISLPLVMALGVSGGLSLASFLSAFIIPLYNVLAVISLTVFLKKEKEKGQFKKVLKGILTNPLILSSVLGIVVLLLRQFVFTMPNGELSFSIARDLPFIDKCLSYVSEATTPLSLLVLGGLLNFDAVRGKTGVIVLGTFCSIVLAPAVALLLAVVCSEAGLITCTAAEFAVLIATFAAPIAFASAIMAEEMGNDGDVARQIVAWTSILSIFTLFITVSLFKYLGLL